MVQRWKPSWVQGRMIPAGVHPIDGYVSAADHARIVAERVAEVTDALIDARREALAELEQAHAAALAATNLRWDAEVARALDVGAEIGRAAAAPRTLTADDPEPAVGSIVMDRIGDPWRAFIGVGGVQVWASAGDIRSASWANLHRIVGPVRLLHDGEDR